MSDLISAFSALALMYSIFRHAVSSTVPFTRAQCCRDAGAIVHCKSAGTVFDFGDWARHRSTSRYLRHMTDLIQCAGFCCTPTAAYRLGSRPSLIQACASRSRIVRGLAQPLLVVVAVASLTAVYETLREVRLFYPCKSGNLYTPIASLQPARLASLACVCLLPQALYLAYRTLPDLLCCVSQTQKIWKPLMRLPRMVVQASWTCHCCSALGTGTRIQTGQMHVGGHLVRRPAAVALPGGRSGVQPHELRAVPAARVPDQHELQQVAGGTQSLGRHPQQVSRPRQAGPGLLPAVACDGCGCCQPRPHTCLCMLMEYLHACL